MLRPIFFLMLFTFTFVPGVKAQEFRASVSILSPTVQMTNKEIFTVLETNIRDFINSYQWTNQKYEENEKIDCSFILTISNYSAQGNFFSGQLQVQYSRPIFKSGYKSPVLNFVDNDLSFSYIINQPLEYQPTNHISNLTSTIAFYCNLILGLDRASMIKGGGEPFFQQMQVIVGNAQSDATASGWRSFDGNKTRFWLNENLNSASFDPFKDCLYFYHRMGLDMMNETEKHLLAKSTIRDGVISLLPIFQKRPNTLMLNAFFDAKSDEIVNIFSGGPEVDVREMVTALKQMDAGRSNKYESLGR